MLAVVLTLLGAAVMAGPASTAYADDCLALGGNPAFLPGECRIDAAKTASDAAHGGPFTISEPLRITGTGSIVVPAAAGGNALTLNIAGGLTVDLPTVSGGGRISGDVTTATGIGATISVEATGNIVVHGSGATGARITSNQTAGSCSGGRGGNISLSTSGSLIAEAGSAITSTSICGMGEIILVADVAVTLKGVVSSDSSIGRGGPVSISAGCTLALASTGRVTSLGKDPGADLVHLQAGCDVLIQGKVESTGPGHVRPPANRCHAPDRSDKPDNAPACVEIWSGGTLTIDSTGVLKGEINADTGQSGGVNCCAWIDLFARGDIQIKGDTTGIFAVHANQSSLNTAFGGLVTVKSTEGNVTASGLAIQASAGQSGGKGGIVTIEASGNVTLDEAQIVARGDVAAGGGFGSGGTVAARAFSGILSWANLPGGVAATGDVQPTGTGIPAAQSGVVLLTSCVGAPINTSSTMMPVTLGTASTPALATNVCSGAAPELPDFVLLPECVCAEGNPDAFVVKTATEPTVIAGGTASYSITVTAGGDANSTNVKLTDVLPAGFNWTLGGTDAGSCSPPPPGPIAGNTTLTCTFGTMASGTSKTITLSTQTSTSRCPAGVTIMNTATITADGDSNASNNSSGPITITVKCPDVSVVKTTTTPTITAGASASYKVVVTAAGTSNSTNVVLTDQLPAGLTWTVGGTDGGNCLPASPVAGGTTLTCSFGTMAPQATKSVTLTATTSAGNCPAINNTATVSSDADTNSGNNTSGPVKITVNCAADVKVTKTTSTPVVTVGAQASYGITVTANGPASSTNVVLTDQLPAGLTWTVGGTDKAGCSPASPVAGGTALTCNFGTMAAQATKSITLTATTSAGNCPAINNTATVSSDGDTNSSNNTSGPVKITVNCAADVKVTKTTTTPTVTAGGKASYDITVTAIGTASSTHVVLTDQLPAGLTWTVGGTDKASCSPASPVAGGTTLTCNFGTMAPQATKSITLTATTPTGSCPAINNTASVSSDSDVNASNNTAGPVKITVNCVCVDETIFKFTGNTASSGTAGNTRTFTANGVSVKATAFSRVNSSGAWATAYLGMYEPGLGVTDGSESGSNSTHRVDNQGGRNNYVLFEFSSPVLIDQVFLDSIVGDSDISVWIGTRTDPFNNHVTLSDAVLASLGSRQDNNTTSTASSRWADINAGGVLANVLVIGASASDTTPDDAFKLSKLALKCP